MSSKVLSFIVFILFLAPIFVFAQTSEPASLALDPNVGPNGSYDIQVINATGRNVYIQMPYLQIVQGSGSYEEISIRQIAPGNARFGRYSGGHYAPEGSHVRFAFDSSRLNSGNPGDAMVHQVTSHTYGGGQDNVTEPILSASGWTKLKMSMFVGGDTSTEGGITSKIYTIHLSIAE